MLLETGFKTRPIRHFKSLRFLPLSLRREDGMNMCMQSQRAEIHCNTAPFDRVFTNSQSLTRPRDICQDSHHRDQSDYLCANEICNSYNRLGSSDIRSNRSIYSPDARLYYYSHNALTISGDYGR